MKRFALLLAVLSLTACDMDWMESPVVHSYQTNTYRVVEINRPKHFRVMLENVKTGERRKVNVSKHCNRWRELQMGTQFTFNEVTYVYPKKQTYYTEIQNRQKICPGN
jgi:hypothetical protein